MKSIFALHLKQVIRENDWILPVLLLLACAVFGQFFAPTNDDPTLVFSARTQAIWACAWLCSIFWVGFVAAKLGSMQRQNHLRGFWKSLGVGDFQYFCAVFAIPNLLNGALFLSAALLSVGVGKAPDVQWGDWIIVNLQGAFLAVLAQGVISALIMALTNYLDASPSFTCGFLLNLYGMYGIEVVDAARRGSNGGVASLADIAWTIGPHLHFADFTSRLTFFWGSLPMRPFLNASMYFCGVLLFGFLIGLRLWKHRAANGG
jgi:hypothetical protein